MAGTIVIALLAVGPAAQATFPGNNGEIVYLDLFGVYSDSETEETLVQVCASGFTPPLFSPDSRWIAYTWNDELYVVPVKGGSRRFVTSPSEELELLDWRAAPASETRC
jgi:hypothetical protein